ncbi:MAG: hypothetical protein HJJLKODD_00558 [Phycisphaerae bacterium]|nr:hypothetical protein [Phycisphaerae bacterium]
METRTGDIFCIDLSNPPIQSSPSVPGYIEAAQYGTSEAFRAMHPDIKEKEHLKGFIVDSVINENETSICHEYKVNQKTSAFYYAIIQNIDTNNIANGDVYCPDGLFINLGIKQTEYGKYHMLYHINHNTLITITPDTGNSE